MMANQPYLPLYTGDWKKDPELSLCSVATRGVWIDLLCSLHDGRIGQVTGTPEQLARLCRCNAAEMQNALLDLQATKAANVSDREGVFTVICRRMKKAIDISKVRAESGSKGGANNKQRENSPDTEIEGEGLLRVREFAKGEGIGMKDAEWFYWKGKGNGWTNGGEPIRDWKATLRSWFKAGYLPSQKAKPGFARPADKAQSIGPIGLRPDRPIAPDWTPEQIAHNQAEIRKMTELLQGKMQTGGN